MTDASAVLASLDRFIGQLAHYGQLINGQRVATQIGSVATTNPLTKQVTNHPCHPSHPEQHAPVEADHERFDSPPRPAEDPDERLARKVSSVGGYSGKSGKSSPNQSLTGGHHKNAHGESGNSPSDQGVVGYLICPGNPGGQEFVSPADTFRSEPAWWRDQYEERSRHAELGDRRYRAEAALVAWGELQWRWHKQCGERMP
jgi:hypothetical protein